MILLAFQCVLVHLVTGSNILLNYAHSSGYSREILSQPDIHGVYNTSYVQEYNTQRTVPSDRVAPEIFPSAVTSVPQGRAAGGQQYTIKQNVQETKQPAVNKQQDRVQLSTATGDLVIFASTFCDTFTFTGPCVQYPEPTQSQRPALNNDGLATMWFDDQTLQCSNCVYFPPSQFEQEQDYVNSRHGQQFPGENVEKSFSMKTRDDYEPIYWETTSYRGAAGYSQFVNYVDLKDVQGIAGLGFSTWHDVAKAQPLVHQLLQSVGLKDPYNQVKSNTLRVSYGLDLNREGPSTLYVGGAAEQYRSSLEWTDTSLTVDSAAFVAQDQTVCGRTLVKEVLVAVDSLNPCLSLPERLFDFFISWLPVECFGAPYNPEKRQCYFRGSVTDELPTLQFRVNSYGSILYVPLRTLLLDQQQQCVRRSSLPYIHLGTLPLSALYTQIDMSDRTVGFANKFRTSPIYNQCLPRVECRNMQTSYTAFNGCISPLCQDYYLFSTSSDGTLCQASAGMHLFVGFILGQFLLTEAGMWIAEYFKQQHTLQTAPHLTLEWVAEHIQLEEDQQSPHQQQQQAQQQR